MSYKEPEKEPIKASTNINIEPMLIEGADSDIWTETGFPKRHHEAFSAVAKDTGCVIMTRVPGEACKDLLDEQYDAKSFHIKAKSCKKGVAAGFLCLDPLFNKAGIDGAQTNLKNNHKSLTEVYEKNHKGEEYESGVTPLVISDNRYQWLKDKEQIVECQEDNKHTFITAKMKSPIAGQNNIGLLFIKRANSGTDVNLWEVYYDLNSLYEIDFTMKNSKDALRLLFNCGSYFNEFISYQQKERQKILSRLTSIEGGTYESYFPVLAMTNPYRNYEGEYSYLNAVTGDYDLFAVWPKKDNVSEDDRRLQSMTLDTKNKEIIDAENKAQKDRESTTGVAVGNISYRVYLTGQYINQKMSDGPKAKGGINRVFHSDEGGRPFVNDVDVAVAFTPDGKAYYLKDDGPKENNGKALKHFATFCADQGYAIIINTGWAKALEDIKDRVTWIS